MSTRSGRTGPRCEIRFLVYFVLGMAPALHTVPRQVPTRRATRRVGALFKPFSTRQCLKPIALKNASASALLSFTVTRIVAL